MTMTSYDSVDDVVFVVIWWLVQLNKLVKFPFATTWIMLNAYNIE